MKILKSLLTSAVLLISLNASATDSTGSEEVYIPAKTVVLHQKTSSNRPKMPSSSVLECYYGDGYITIIFPDTTDNVLIRVFNSDEEYADSLVSDNPTMLIPTLSGIYDIECTTDDGKIFYGQIEF